MKLFFIFVLVLCVSTPVLANDEAITAADSSKRIDQASDKKGSIMLPHVGEGMLMLPHNFGPCTADILGAIHYNSVTKSPETCTSTWLARMGRIDLLQKSGIHEGIGL